MMKSGIAVVTFLLACCLFADADNIQLSNQFYLSPSHTDWIAIVGPSPESHPIAADKVPQGEVTLPNSAADCEQSAVCNGDIGITNGVADFTMERQIFFMMVPGIPTDFSSQLPVDMADGRYIICGSSECAANSLPLPLHREEVALTW